jgi:hypothetical protein
MALSAKLPEFQIAPINIGDFEFAASRRAQLEGDIEYGVA